MHSKQKNEALLVGPAKVAWCANIFAFFMHLYEDHWLHVLGSNFKQEDFL